MAKLGIKLVMVIIWVIFSRQKITIHQIDQNTQALAFKVCPYIGYNFAKACVFLRLEAAE